MSPETTRLRLGRSATTLAAVVAAFCCTYGLCRAAHAGSGPAILSAILALSFARRPRATHDRQPLIGPATVAATAIGAACVAWLFQTDTVLGAVVFTAAMSGSIWLRNLGERGRALGTMIALPFAAILVVPARADAPGGVLVDLGLVTAAGIVAHACVTVRRWATAASPLAQEPAAGATRTASRARPPGLSPATRLALQMAVGLGAAFACGLLLFAGHWGWCVFSAFIVANGTRSRGDAAYKGVLRFAGAMGGTLAAGALAHVWHPSGVPQAMVIFAILFAGLALRDVSYVYWAACMTLILALIATPNASSLPFLSLRLEAILIGAACAVLAAWFVAPITVEAVIRRRLAGALTALGDFASSVHSSDEERAAKLALYERHMAELEQVTPPARWHRRLLARRSLNAHPAHWVDLAQGVHVCARALDTSDAAGERRRLSLHRAIGMTRRAIAAHGKPDAPPDTPSISESLRTLHDMFAAS